MKASDSCRFTSLFPSLSGAMVFLPLLIAAEPQPTAKEASSNAVPEIALAENRRVPNLHSLAVKGRHTNIFRCANPVGDIADQMKGLEPTDAERQKAKEQMQHLFDSGVRTVVSLQRQDPLVGTKKNPEYAAVALEKHAAQAVGLKYVACPMGNSGKNSLQDMSSDAVSNLIASIGDDIVDFSKTGGVVFHCKSGKDRTGLVAGYIRIKHQGWTVDQALVEMRQLGHVWKKFLKPGNSFSWHEEHLRAIGKTLEAEK